MLFWVRCILLRLLFEELGVKLQMLTELSYILLKLVDFCHAVGWFYVPMNKNDSSAIF